MHVKAVLYLTLIAAAGLTIRVDLFASSDTQQNILNPRGKIHIPIGIANSLDTLKTFVEAEGNFSPGVGSYGIYFWLFDKNTGKLITPTLVVSLSNPTEGVKCEHGLADGRYLIPWSEWSAGDVTVRTELCQVKRTCPMGDLFIVGCRVGLKNTSDQSRDVSLYVALRPVGPAGADLNGAKQEKLLCPNAAGAFSFDAPDRRAALLHFRKMGDCAARHTICIPSAISRSNHSKQKKT